MEHTFEAVSAEIERLRKAMRPPIWEDDISANVADLAPFDLLPPLASRSREELGDLRNYIDAKLLAGRDPNLLATKDTYAIPSPQDREFYARRSDPFYWAFGLSDCFKVLAVAARLGRSIKRILDVGCASGRVLRHFAIQTDIPEVWGRDINQRHIRWLCEHLPPRVIPVFNHCIPSLPMEDNYFDVVCAFSVFTHIDSFETSWLAEIRRILAPGGIAYLTIHNEETWESLRDESPDVDKRLLHSLRAIDPQVDAAIASPMPKTRFVYRFLSTGPYRAQVFHSNAYVEQVWSRFFEVVEIIPLHHAKQAVVVLRKG